jgi:hypothetical protein
MNHEGCHRIVACGTTFYKSQVMADRQANVRFGSKVKVRQVSWHDPGTRKLTSVRKRSTSLKCGGARRYPGAQKSGVGTASLSGPGSCGEPVGAFDASGEAEILTEMLFIRGIITSLEEISLMFHIIHWMPCSETCVFWLRSFCSSSSQCSQMRGRPVSLAISNGIPTSCPQTKQFYLGLSLTMEARSRSLGFYSKAFSEMSKLQLL